MDLRKSRAAWFLSERQNPFPFHLHKPDCKDGSSNQEKVALEQKALSSLL